MLVALELALVQYMVEEAVALAALEALVLHLLVVAMVVTE
mgnify:CR=1 FL=1